MTTADRVISRFKTANLPPRLHIQSDDGDFFVWLEGPNGTRVFEPEKALPLKGLQLLYRAILTDRPRIEAAWVRDVMVQNGWLDVVIEDHWLPQHAHVLHP